MGVPIALTIAGSDSGGGAGIQADIKTFSALGVYGCSVITALTAQNTRAVTNVHLPPLENITAQLRAIFEDIRVDSVKIGMLANAEIVQTVSKTLVSFKVQKIVVDPVMVAKSGAKLLDDEAVNVLRNELVPLATVITPNISETAVLLNRTVSEVLNDFEGSVKKLQSLGCNAAILKGGHGGQARSDDYLYDGDVLTVLDGERVNTKNTHGTGCSFSAAVAAELAKGFDLTTAAKKAKAYISQAIAQANRLEIGSGFGPVHHFFDRW